MFTRRLTSLLTLIAIVLLTLAATEVRAQGITTGAISGVVTDSAGAGLQGVQLVVTNRTTGFTARTTSRDGGRYFIQGLEVGGPYSVSARRIGFSPEDRDGIEVGLSQNQRVDLRMGAQATTLSSVEVRSTPDISASNSGTKTVVSDSALQRLPTLNRNLTDFIKLSPQVSQTGAGSSGGGMSNRMNNVQIDGASERDVFGLGSTGTPGAEVGSRSVSIEAVKQFQILLAPFDVRQGNFGGLLLNAVSKSGTNDFRGSAYFGYRDQDFGRNVPVLRGTDYQRKQYAFTLGGPVIKDRLHFFFAPEFQSETEPVSGPFVGQAADLANPLQIAQADITRYESIMRNKYQRDPGTGGQVAIDNPLQNFFGRLDFRLNDVHRVVFRYNYSYGERLRQQNSRQVNRLVYSDNFHTFGAVKNAPVVQLFSTFKGGSFNELFVGYNGYKHRRVPPTLFPQVTVTVPRTGGGNSTIIGGADQSSQGNELDTDTYELTNNFTKPMGDHTVTIGTRNELVQLRNLFSEASYGVWTFTNLNNFENGVASSFRRAIFLKDEGNAFFDALQSAFYVQDQWQATPKLSLTLGARADVSSFLTDNPYSPAIDTAYGRRTDNVPDRSIQFSPRVGFNWDVTGDQVNTLRGGVGMFVGTPPYVWLENAYINNGSVITNLNCSGTASPAPAFNIDPTVYSVCANGTGAKPIGRVSFLDKDLKFPQPFRGTLGFDRELPWNLVGTVEGLYSKTLNQLFFVNRNISQTPRGVDKRGRVLYGDTILVSGSALASLAPAVRANGGTARFSEAIDIVNQSKDYSYTLTTQLQRRFTGNWEGMVAYAFSRSRDVQSFSSSTHGSNWRFGRTLAGDQLAATTGVSNFDQPHKFVANATYSLKWGRGFSTDISMFYQGVSGSAHDYVYGGGSAFNSGDLNADGSQGNDLIYVPLNAADASEIRFNPSGTGATAISAAVQAEAFEKFITNSPCLNKQRGQIIERNSCRLPFTNQMDLSVRQAIPTIGGQRVSVQFDVFNFGNLLNKKWGQIQINQASNNSNVPILSHVGQTSIDPKTADPIFTFNTAQQEYVVGNFASNYWRTQVSVRYSF